MKAVRLLFFLNVFCALFIGKTQQTSSDSLLNVVLKQFFNPCFDYLQKKSYITLKKKVQLTEVSVNKCFPKTDICKILNKQHPDNYGLIDTFNHVSWWGEFAANVTVSREVRSYKVVDLILQNIFVDVFRQLCTEGYISSNFNPLRLANEALTVCQRQKIYKLLSSQMEVEKFSRLVQTEYWWQKTDSSYQNVLRNGLPALTK